MSKTAVEIYTDGACSGNPGPGGWGAVLYYGDVKKEIFGGVADTTNNRMELTAAIEALRALKKNCVVNLYTDSSYVRDGITNWIRSWKKCNWRKGTKGEVKNRDLWQELDELAAMHQITWHWVRGHSGIPGNELADQLAVRGCDQVMK